MNLQITREMLNHDYQQLSEEMTKNPCNEIDFILMSYSLAETMLKYINVTEPIYNLTAYDVFSRYLGSDESSEIYRMIQTWYYGSFVNDAWCATSLSWILYKLGILTTTIHKKCENVYLMTKELWTAVAEGNVMEIPDNGIMQGDIVIFSWDGNFSITSKKHCAVATSPILSNTISVIGGNQDNSIKIKEYPVNNIITAFRPDYTKVTLKSLENL